MAQLVRPLVGGRIQIDVDIGDPNLHTTADGLQRLRDSDAVILNIDYFHNLPAVSRAILNGWELSGITSFSSGAIFGS